MFTRFGGVTDTQVKDKIARGTRIRAVLSQPQYAPLRLADEVALVMALQEGLLDRLPPEGIKKFRGELTGFLNRSAAAIVDEITRTGGIDDAGRAALKLSLSKLVIQIVPPIGRRQHRNAVMAERLADVVTQIRNVRQLEAVVTAMRGIAASRAQQARSLRDGIDAYSQVISRAIGQALNLLAVDTTAAAPLRRHRLGLILFCAEQGFAGAFSERVLDAAADDLAGAVALVVGTRGAAVAAERGIAPAWAVPMANHVDAIPRFANQLADALYGYVADGAVTKVDIVFSRSVAAGGILIDRRSLLPIDYKSFARPVERLAPLTTLTPALLLERLAAEYRLRTALRNRGARIRSGKRSTDVGHDSRQDQHRSETRRARPARAPAPAGRNHDRNRRTRGRSGSVTTCCRVRGPCRAGQGDMSRSGKAAADDRGKRVVAGFAFKCLNHEPGLVFSTVLRLDRRTPVKEKK